jgi:hypothetical protein
LFLVPHCFLGSGVLLREIAQVPEGDPASEAGLGMHSHSREDGLTQLWWIQGAITATLTMVGVDKITTKGPLQRGLMIGHFSLVFFFT